MIIQSAHYVTINRYDLGGDDSSDHVVAICCYEAKRLFKDRIVGVESRETFDNILSGIFRSDWNTAIFDNKEGRTMISYR